MVPFTIDLNIGAVVGPDGVGPYTTLQQHRYDPFIISFGKSFPIESILSFVEFDLKSEPQIVALYSTANHSINFTHLTLDHWGNLYAGGSNWLYQFNNLLGVAESVRTGPIFDSPSCSPTDCSGVDESSISLSNNINKVLVVDELSNSLLVCGTAHQGLLPDYVIPLASFRKTHLNQRNLTLLPIVQVRVANIVSVPLHSLKS